MNWKQIFYEIKNIKGRIKRQIKRQIEKNRKKKKKVYKIFVDFCFEFWYILLKGVILKYGKVVKVPKLRRGFAV